jgi:hypothetical protein
MRLGIRDLSTLAWKKKKYMYIYTHYPSEVSFRSMTVHVLLSAQGLLTIVIVSRN